MKSIIRLALIALLITALSACGSQDISCDDVQYYQLSEEGKRVEAPEGLDDLDPLQELTLPEPSPREPRAPGSDCFDRPPKINLEA